MIPFDPEKPIVTCGIRIGTPAVTTRGMEDAEMAQMAALIGRVLDAPADDAVAGQGEGGGEGADAALPPLPRPGRRLPESVR